MHEIDDVSFGRHGGSAQLSVDSRDVVSVSDCSGGLTAFSGEGRALLRDLEISTGFIILYGCRYETHTECM